MKRAILIVSTALVLMLSGASVAAAQPAELAFVEPEKVAVTYSGEKSGEVSVWLKNTGSREVTPKFSAEVQNDEGKEVDVEVKVVGAEGTVVPPPPIGAGQVLRYRIYVEKASKTSGQLVASASGVGPASVPLSLGPELATARGVDGVLVFSFGLAIIALACAWFYGHGKVGLGDTLGGVAELDFSKSFASTITAVGALLGTIIGASVLPEETVNLSKSGFIGLNLTFGIAIVIAAAFTTSFQKSEAKKNKDDKAEWKVESYVLPFMVGTLVTLWAVFGELWTIFLLIEELGLEKGFTALGVTVLQVLLVIAGIAMFPYTGAKVKVAVAAPEPAPLPGQAQPPKPAVQAVKLL